MPQHHKSQKSDAGVEEAASLLGSERGASHSYKGKAEESQTEEMAWERSRKSAQMHSSEILLWKETKPSRRLRPSELTN